jgi:dsDNA-binding SOS-regulon protein
MNNETAFSIIKQKLLREFSQYNETPEPTKEEADFLDAFIQEGEEIDDQYNQPGRNKEEQAAAQKLWIKRNRDLIRRVELCEQLTAITPPNTPPPNTTPPQ